MLLSKKLTERTWIQGHGSYEARMCLVYAVEKLLLDDCSNYQDIEHLERIARRLFPERLARAGHYNTTPRSRLMYFNDHKETVWPDVEKVIKEYEREVEAGVEV